MIFHGWSMTVVPGLAAQRDDVFVGFEAGRASTIPVVAHDLPDILHRVHDSGD